MKLTLRIALIGLALSMGTLASYGQESTVDGTSSTQSDAVLQAIQMNLAEVNLGKLASRKAQDSRVKAFADMMVVDHIDALSKLRAVPGAPSSDPRVTLGDQKLAERLSKLSGAEFDREYMAAMVNGHQEALTFFEKESSVAAESLPELAQVKRSVAGGAGSICKRP